MLVITSITRSTHTLTIILLSKHFKNLIIFATISVYDECAREQRYLAYKRVSNIKAVCKISLLASVLGLTAGQSSRYSKSMLDDSVS